ncbi:HNH endonuclease domain protein [Luminiphilus syltensis NOR5-1B]|uniref:HNH endonuclease domain protein n=1 Tax=Luminiphilus syltensis NOR5-1B TaxID=565045 RepID=B8KUW9_9GAMM|nr:HNH endonuclease [Luminiphilus syltensis]EED36038.1 HNH endonuclease domain protein [Luminiphilus syltensis NOR5-1B]
MHAILKLDVAGQPRGWLTLHEAVTAYARGDVLFGIGDALPPVYGGIQRCSGERSQIVLQPIIAIDGRVRGGFTPPLCNRTLFRRDDHRCLYCGQQFSRSELTRDHVLPVSRGGDNRWENVVAACRRCNWAKDNRTPEEAGMPLLAVPFRPNSHEWHFLAKDRVMADQMEYLSQQFRADRAWAH